MAQLVAGIGVPHSPHYPSQFPKDGPEETPRLYHEMKEHLDAARPDAIIIIANDHFNTFFLNNFPTFAIGVTDATFGPNDQTKMPRYDIAVPAAVARHLRDLGVHEGFDLAVVDEFGVDHAMMVPLHYLTDGIKTPVVPIWVNTFVKPLPSARRCYALGRALRGAIDSLPDNLRVAVIGSGSFSLEIGGPKIDPGKRNSVPDMAWSRHVHARVKQAEVDELITEATPERMWKAGNIGGELLNWIALLGVIGKAKPTYIADHQEKDGHAYAAWRWN
jgi:aromatic ring-opening dioxygenase catalytic subunit (LigB family)